MYATTIEKENVNCDVCDYYYSDNDITTCVIKDKYENYIFLELLSFVMIIHNFHNKDISIPLPQHFNP